MPFKGLRKFVKGKKPSQSTETIAQLRKQVNTLQIKARQYDKMAQLERERAKQFLRTKNKAMAAQSLKNSQMYMKQSQMISQRIANLEKIIFTIQTTQDNVQLTKVLQQADKVIQANISEAAPEVVEETMMSLEESIEQAEAMNEILSDTSLTEIGMDSDDLESIDQQLAALEAEMEAESAATREVTVPSSTETPSVATPVDVAESSVSVESTKKKDEEKKKKRLEEIENLKRLASDL